jgi:hypothetical protein
MKNQSYHASIELGFPPEFVFNKINDVSNWWSLDFQGKSTALNDEFIISHGDRHYSKQKLVEFIPNKKVVWLVTESKLNWIENNKAEWTNTKMVFEISSKADKTLLHFTHEGLFPDQECYSRCSQGWDLVIKEKLYNLITNEELHQSR